jgi:single-strand DNA-binding protein
MVMKRGKEPETGEPASALVNQVKLQGRVSRDPERRTLPSGDEMWTFMVVVPRPPGGRSRQSVDAIDCVVWGGRIRTQVSGWAADDVVEVSGPLRKRFYQGGGGAASRVEVEVTAGRMVKRGVSRRATTA